MKNDLIFYIKEKKIKKNIKKLNKVGNIYYPMKTNNNKKLIQLLNKNQLNFAISSIENLKLLKKMNIDMSKVMVINVLNTNLYKKSYMNGVRIFTFDNYKELLLFSQYANLNECKIIIRISLMNISNDVTHIGATYKESIDMLNFLINKCNNIGLSFYLDKSHNNKLKKMCNFIIDRYKNFNLSINISGLRKYNKKNINIIKKLKKYFNEINIEPGYVLVNNAIDAKIKIIRLTYNKVIIKNGIYTGFFDKKVINRKFHIFINKSKLYNKKKNNTNQIYLFGGSGDNIDKLGKYYIKNNINKKIKNIYIKNIGAYFESVFLHNNELKIKTKIIGGKK